MAERRAARRPGVPGTPLGGVSRLPKLYQGDYLPDPNVGEYKGRTIVLDAERPMPIHTDGDVLGTTPATFDLLRLPITLKL